MSRQRLHIAGGIGITTLLRRSVIPLAWAADRSSRPHRSPMLLDPVAQERICAAQRRTGWGPRWIAGQTGHLHSTVWKVLHRHGVSRRAREPRDTARRYEWPRPGDLLHIDTKRYARFERPGHAMTGVRNKTAAEKRAGWGYEFAHVIVDDHTRLGVCRAASRRARSDRHRLC